MNNDFNVLESWGINIPDEYDCPLEYINQKFPKNVFSIDSCPYTVLSNEKYEQFEVYYQQVLKGKLNKKSFIEYENKFLNVIIKLWLYNITRVEFYSDWHLIRKHRRIDKKYRKKIKVLKNKLRTSNIFEVTDRLELELIVQLSIRDDTIGTAFYFEDYKILIIPSWSYFIVYFKNIDMKEIVKDIVMTEGLYLR